MNGPFQYVIENLPSIGMRTLEHVWLAAAALLISAPIGLITGVLLSRPAARRVRGFVLFILGLGQTIPSIALLALAIGLIGVGALPAILAIAVYAIIPIARGTTVGLLGVDHSVVDAARGAGMSSFQIIRAIELPLALPGIVGGLRLGGVGAVSAAALAYLIGAGGLGEFIFTGISLLLPVAMLTGAIPAVVMAITVDRMLDRLERRVTRRDHAR